MSKRGRPRTLDIPHPVGSAEYRRAYYLLNRDRMIAAGKRRYRRVGRPLRGIDPDASDQRRRQAPRRETAWAHLLRRSAKKASRARGISWDNAITADWLRSRMDLQGGRCFYTGIPFVLAIGDRKRGMRRPSIDRRDSSKGYTPDNTVLVLTAINYLKNDYAEPDVLALLEEIRNTRPNG